MATLSPMREAWPLVFTTRRHLTHRGKVRDSYDLENDLLLIVATDGVSIFDFVLNAVIPGKGRCLTAITHFWLTYLEKLGYPTHLVAAGREIDDFLPERLRSNPDLQSRAMVVNKLSMTPVEFVGRSILAGSAWKAYQSGKTVHGHTLEPGLCEGSALSPPLFTPTTKSEHGHDVPLDHRQVMREHPRETALFLEAHQELSRAFIERGLLLVDAKAELGARKYGLRCIGDEIGTPDASRIWDLAAYEHWKLGSTEKKPESLDKQYLRAWGIREGVDRLDPLSESDCALVHSLEVPIEVIMRTVEIYEYVGRRIIGISCEGYAHTYLGVDF